MPVNDDTAGVIKSADRLFQIVETLKDLDGATVTELSDHLDLPPSTTHRYLKTLHQQGYVDKRNGEYHLGLKFLDIGGYVRHSKPVRREIKPTVRELAQETNEAASFIMEHRGLGVFVYRETSESGVNTEVRLGKRSSLHLSSGGKAILANLPEERIEDILDHHGLPQKTTQSIQDREELLTELEEIRERGYAIARSEHTDGVNSVGAPVRLSDGTVLGAITIVGPAFRMQGERLTEELPPLLLGKINEFVLNFSHS
ncbi:helix-turn-helix domain-containing protein [Natronorubrum sp. JWXQ-INN-674]|uniref:Helix-turn-helix domain-containing protein n=1 Tax=Natronorubrum halalkaliphilum TaxID=2691917 RepID=A0A6B0VP38_9EURY|nr:IclR family transcriptional regulator [Natronorubrum halalkaliphilum]MXV63015.1 helix-turn-helix domain-containing protein [Natronorubrum halalkaliphilum]